MKEILISMQRGTATKGGSDKTFKWRHSLVVQVTLAEEM